jgi:hypothetical protein
MSPSYIVQQIGTGDFTKEENLKLLGNFITEHLGLIDEQVQELQTWELCCQ